MTVLVNLPGCISLSVYPARGSWRVAILHLSRPVRDPRRKENHRKKYAGKSEINASRIKHDRRP